jgi:putative flippase GtrA
MSLVSGTGKLVGKNSISVIVFNFNCQNVFVFKDRLKNILVPEIMKRMLNDGII